MLSGRRDVDVDEIMYLLDEKDLKLIKKHCWAEEWTLF
jgi:hypothetical protein